MKNKLLTMMLIIASAFLTNCGKKSDNNNPPVATAGTCSAVGHVNTTQGCLPQGTCPVGYGQSGNQCYAVGATSTVGTCQAGYVFTQHECLPQTSSCPANYGYYNGSCYPATQSIGVGGVGGSCQAGYVGTAIGCLPQNTCPAGYGYSYGNYNGQTGEWCYPQTY